MKGGSLQPLAGAHGEYAGLKIIKAYHDSRNDSNRNTIIIPTSAHGTNPASATLTGFKVVEVATDERGLVDVESLKPLLNDSVAAIMLTNPNTLGLFEQEIKQIAEAAHQSGALLYYDGANLNAIMGICRPADMGFDVVHLNLHKTFSTPHGGGGPGAGPVLVADFLVPFLPVPTIIKEQERYRFVWDNPHSIGKVSCFWGNFLVLVKAYAYVLTMGADGLKEASSYAVLNANYMQAQLKEVFELPYDQLCMHEFVLSARAFKHQYGITAHDFAKALLDKGIHPPTVYFPLIVSEALMFEPTETEALEDLDAVNEAMKELARLAQTDPNKLKSAPHTTEVGRLDDAKAAKEPKLRYRG
jgi:glycine dehydrogenase subunit 2